MSLDIKPEERRLYLVLDNDPTISSLVMNRDFIFTVDFRWLKAQNNIKI